MPKMIVPCGDHDPPRSSGAAHSVTGVPPDATTVFSFPSLKNAIVLLSGDQNGYAAPAVPSRTVSVPDSKRLTKRLDCLATPSDTTMAAPSGETTGGPSSRPGSAVAEPAGTLTVTLSG